MYQGNGTSYPITGTLTSYPITGTYSKQSLGRT